MPHDLPQLLGKVRALAEGFKAGDNDSAGSFRDLASLLFSLTVGAPGCSPRLTYRKDDRRHAVLGGMAGPHDPLRLRNGHFLKIVVALHLTETEHGPRLKVRDSSYQYQLDQLGTDWVFRYDYERTPIGHHPAAHMHVRGSLSASDALAEGHPLERVHFPTQRASFEAILRLLIEQFRIEAASPAEIWRPVLAAAEGLFAEIAHQPLSGPPA